MEESRISITFRYPDVDGTLHQFETKYDNSQPLVLVPTEKAKGSSSKENDLLRFVEDILPRRMFKNSQNVRIFKPDMLKFDLTHARKNAKPWIYSAKTGNPVLSEFRIQQQNLLPLQATNTTNQMVNVATIANWKQELVYFPFEVSYTEGGKEHSIPIRVIVTKTADESILCFFIFMEKGPDLELLGLIVSPSNQEVFAPNFFERETRRHGQRGGDEPAGAPKKPKAAYVFGIPTLARYKKITGDAQVDLYERGRPVLETWLKSAAQAGVDVEKRFRAAFPKETVDAMLERLLITIIQLGGQKIIEPARDAQTIAFLISQAQPGSYDLVLQILYEIFDDISDPDRAQRRIRGEVRMRAEKKLTILLKKLDMTRVFMGAFTYFDIELPSRQFIEGKVREMYEAFVEEMVQFYLDTNDGVIPDDEPLYMPSGSDLRRLASTKPLRLVQDRDLNLKLWEYIMKDLQMRMYPPKWGKGQWSDRPARPEEPEEMAFSPPASPEPVRQWQSRTAARLFQTQGPSEVTGAIESAISAVEEEFDESVGNRSSFLQEFDDALFKWESDHPGQEITIKDLRTQVQYSILSFHFVAVFNRFKKNLALPIVVAPAPRAPSLPKSPQKRAPSPPRAPSLPKSPQKSPQKKLPPPLVPDVEPMEESSSSSEVEEGAFEYEGEDSDEDYIREAVVRVNAWLKERGGKNAVFASFVSEGYIGEGYVGEDMFDEFLHYLVRELTDGRFPVKENQIEQYFARLEKSSSSSSSSSRSSSPVRQRQKQDNVDAFLAKYGGADAIRQRIRDWLNDRRPFDKETNLTTATMWTEYLRDWVRTHYGANPSIDAISDAIRDVNGKRLPWNVFLPPQPAPKRDVIELFSSEEEEKPRKKSSAVTAPSRGTSETEISRRTQTFLEKHKLQGFNLKTALEQHLGFDEAKAELQAQNLIEKLNEWYAENTKDPAMSDLRTWSNEIRSGRSPSKYLFPAIFPNVRAQLIGTHMGTCAACRAPNAKSKAGCCGSTRYCNQDCAQSDWASHSLKCNGAKQ